MKGELESKGLRVYVKKTKMIISSKNAGKVTVEGKCSCVVCRKGVGSNLRKHKKCSGIRG